MAQQVGFTVSEMQALFNGFTAETPASGRWQELAHQKLVETDALIHRAQAMKQVLEEKLVRCRCLTLDECANYIVDQVNEDWN